MSVREYIGARYVPLFIGEWDNTITYEPLSIVQYQGNSYTSRQFIPIGIEITNEDYWALTGNYNAQVEAYRQEVQSFDDRITENANDISALELAIGDSESGLIHDVSENASDIAALELEIGDENSGIIHDVSENASDIAALELEIGDENSGIIHDVAANTNAISANEEKFNRFKNSVKVDILPAVTDGWTTLFSGRLIDSATDITRRFQPQGMAYNNGCLYVAMINTQSNYADVYKFDRVNNTVSKFASNIFMGHCNTMTFSPKTNKYYVLPGQSNLNDSDSQFFNVVFAYDNNFGNMERIYCPGTVGTISYDYALEQVTYVDNSTGYIYDFDETAKTFEKRDIEIPTRDDVYDTPSQSEIYIFQGGAVYNDFYCVTIGWNGLRDPNAIVVYDLKNGTLERCYQYPECTDIFPIGEGEDIAFDENGMMFINGATVYSFLNNYNAQTTIFRSGIFCDLVSGSAASAVYPTDIMVKNSNVYNPTTATSLVFKELDEVLLYAKYHRTGLIKVDKPDGSQDEIYWYNGMLQLNGLDLSLQFQSGVGIQGQIYCINNARLIWYNTLRMKLPYGLPSNQAYPVRCYQSTLIGDILDTYPGNSIQSAAAQFINCGMFCLSAQPTLETGVAGTAIAVTRNNGFGYRFTPFTGQ